MDFFFRLSEKQYQTPPLLQRFWKTLQLNIKIKIHQSMWKNNIKPLLKIVSQIPCPSNKTPRPSAGSFRGNLGKTDFMIFLLWIISTKQEKQNPVWSMGRMSQVDTKGFYNFTLRISISRPWEFIRHSGVKADSFQCVKTQYIFFKQSLKAALTLSVEWFLPWYPDGLEDNKISVYHSLQFECYVNGPFNAERNHLDKIVPEVFLFIVAL